MNSFLFWGRYIIRKWLLNGEGIDARFNFSGADATIATALADSEATGTTSNIAATVSSGGQVGDNYVILAVTTDSNNAALAADTITLAMASTKGFNLKSQSDVSVSYALYSTPENAVNQATSLASGSETIIKFDSAVSHTGDAGSPQNVDVTNESKKFEKDSSSTNSETLTQLGKISIADSATAGVIANGTNDFGYQATADITNLKVEITGAADGFSATTDDQSSFTASKVFLDIDADCASTGTNETDPTDTLTASTATWNDILDNGIGDVAGGLEANGSDDLYVCMEVTGNTVIPTGTAYSAVLTPTVASTYKLDPITVTLGTLGKNGKSIDLGFLTNPGTAYTTRIRISNTGAIDADVSFTMVNDDGVSASFTLADLASLSSATVEKGKSTKLIAMQEFYDAAVVAEPTYATTDSKGRSRMTISAPAAGLSAQAFTVSSDGTTLLPFDVKSQ